MDKSLKDIGIIVGRFQVNELHPGHIDLIETVNAKHKRVVIFLGTTPALVTRNNPLDFVARKEMLLKRFPAVSVLSIPDSPSDKDWSIMLDSRIREACPVGSVMLYGSRSSFISSYHGHFETTELPDHHNTSGTEVRIELSKEVKSSPDFRAGVIFAAYNQYPKVYPTVDVAITRDGKFLLGRKANQSKYRFIGGFADPTDDSYEDAARREAMEETGLEIGNITYVGSARIDDWRYRSEQDKIITHLFIAEALFGKAEARDDIAELKWVLSADLDEELFVPEHVVLYDLLKKKIN
ncbi:MAG: ADP-ribose pyrophosphatase [Bacteroidetes bacterium]|nr:MAG: ADP-ribose pyrophosphatase [Bacteroidota bacterium]